MKNADTACTENRNWHVLLGKLAPKAVTTVVEAFPTVSAVFCDFNIDTPLRQSHFLAQALHETGFFTRIIENLNYSAQGLRKTWPNRFPDDDVAKKYAHNAEAIANKVYARADLGNTSPGDGWKYRGRGVFQLTGKANYVTFGELSQLPLVAQPELALASRYLFRIAALFWTKHNLSRFADQDDLDTITRRINGSTRTVPERAEVLATVKGVLGCP